MAGTQTNRPLAGIAMKIVHVAWPASGQVNLAVTEDLILVTEGRNGMNSAAAAGPQAKLTSPPESDPGLQLKTPRSLPADEQHQTHSGAQH